MNQQGKISKYLLMCMGLAYVIMGVLVINKNWFLVKLQTTAALGLGSLLILYGIFRTYRAYKSL